MRKEKSQNTQGRSETPFVQGAVGGQYNGKNLIQGEYNNMRLT